MFSAVLCCELLLFHVFHGLLVNGRVHKRYVGMNYTQFYREGQRRHNIDDLLEAEIVFYLEGFFTHN